MKIQTKQTKKRGVYALLADGREIGFVREVKDVYEVRFSCSSGHPVRSADKPFTKLSAARQWVADNFGLARNGAGDTFRQGDSVKAHNVRLGRYVTGHVLKLLAGDRALVSWDGAVPEPTMVMPVANLLPA